MGRNATIQIWNRTGQCLEFVSETVEYGTYQKDYRPPIRIEDDNLGMFVVGNLTGVEVGPKGSILYASKGGAVTVTVEWNHPFGEQESAYRCYGETPGVITAVLYPTPMTGDDQEIAWTVFPAASAPSASTPGDA
jgi:hypothetical protein